MVKNWIPKEGRREEEKRGRVEWIRSKWAIIEPETEGVRKTNQLKGNRQVEMMDGEVFRVECRFDGTSSGISHKV